MRRSSSTVTLRVVHGRFHSSNFSPFASVMSLLGQPPDEATAVAQSVRQAAHYSHCAG